MNAFVVTVSGWFTSITYFPLDHAPPLSVRTGMLGYAFPVKASETGTPFTVMVYVPLAKKESRLAWVAVPKSSPFLPQRHPWSPGL